MPSVSKYNAIRFVLDEAYVAKAGQASQEVDWTAWFRKVSRMFHHRIPSALLEGLSTKCEALRALCDAHRAAAPTRSADRQSCHDRWVERHDRWVKRRDEGNARAAAERRSMREQQAAAAAAIRRRDSDAAWESMKPVWEKRLSLLEETRRREMAELGIQ